jgi:starch synthase
VFVDKQGSFHKDNDERAIFFCKGVLETVKKLGWAPDIVHCNDWMTSLVPLYIKTTYKNDPIFQNTKTVFTVYNNGFSHVFGEGLLDKVKMLDIDDAMLDSLKTADYAGFIKMGAEYADAVIQAKQQSSESLNKVLNEIDEKKRFEVVKGDDNYLDSYYNLYNELVGEV